MPKEIGEFVSVYAPELSLVVGGIIFWIIAHFGGKSLNRRNKGVNQGRH
jgi:hypothetical protein